MRIMSLRALGAAALLLTLAMLAAGEKPVIKMHVWEGTNSHWLNNAIAEFIIEGDTDTRWKWSCRPPPC